MDCRLCVIGCLKFPEEIQNYPLAIDRYLLKTFNVQCSGMLLNSSQGHECYGLILILFLVGLAYKCRKYVRFLAFPGSERLTFFQ